MERKKKIVLQNDIDLPELNKATLSIIEVVISGIISNGL